MASGIMGIMPWDYPWPIGNNQNEIVLRTISPILQSTSNPEMCWACSAHGEVSGSWGHWTCRQNEARVRDFQPKAVIFSLDFYEMPIWFLCNANLDVLVGPWHNENHSEQQSNFSEGVWSPCHFHWKADPYCLLWGLFLDLVSGGTPNASKLTERCMEAAHLKNHVLLALWLGGASLSLFSIVRWPNCTSASAHFIPSHNKPLFYMPQIAKVTEL